MIQTQTAGSAVIHPAEQPVADRGTGIRTIALVAPEHGARAIINGITIIGPGAAIPLHVHNCEESVMVLDGSGIAVIDNAEHRVSPGDTSWIATGVPHYFRNPSEDQPLRIFWTYASATATRTLVATGETRSIAAGYDTP